VTSGIIRGTSLPGSLDGGPDLILVRVVVLLPTTPTAAEKRSDQEDEKKNQLHAAFLFAGMLSGF
jgi:hypothetical protein